MSDNQQTIETKVGLLVQLDPTLCESSNKLLSAYWRVIDHISNVDDICNATPSESITRAFRSLRAKGVITMPADILAIRQARREEFRQFYATK
jgi:hypothetical protein